MSSLLVQSNDPAGKVVPQLHGTAAWLAGLRPEVFQDILVIDRYAHLVGGCRMGSDPERSVVDSDHRAWEVPNLFIADGSVMPTQGSANPALTIMALASRLAERLALKRAGAEARRPLRQPRQAAQPQPAPSPSGAG